MIVFQIFVFLKQKYRFQGINEGEFRMVIQRFVTRKFNHRTVCWLLFFFVYQIVIDCFLPVVVCSVEVAVVGVSVQSKGDDHVSNMYIFSEVATVGVSVKSKGDDHVSNIYIFQQKYRFQGLDGGKF